MKALRLSVEASLKKLRTNYIDILYLHWWEYTTPVEEVMNGLHNLITDGKVLYLGISDSPAWIVAKANTYARDHGKTPFVIYQGAWSVLQRDMEREIIPMAQNEGTIADHCNNMRHAYFVSLGMAIAPWNVLAGGKIRSDADEQKRLESGEGGRVFVDPDWKRNEKERLMCQALEKVAQEVGAKNITSGTSPAYQSIQSLDRSLVAIAWCMQKIPYVFPVIGGRKVEHLHANLEALEISLSPEQIKFLDHVVPFDKGFPYSFFVRSFNIHFSEMLT